MHGGPFGHTGVGKGRAQLDCPQVGSAWLWKARRQTGEGGLGRALLQKAVKARWPRLHPENV